MDKNYQTALDWLDQQQHAMCTTLIDWSNINSSTYNPDGLARMANVVGDTFQALSASQQLRDLAPYQEVAHDGQLIDVPLGQALQISKRPDAPLQVILTGHMDTVFAIDHHFQQVQRIDDNTLNGPGVTDMKGGLLVMCYALQALEQTPFAKNIGWTVFINSDEEIGSPGSAPLLKELAKKHHLGLIFEPAMTPDGKLASQRKGSGKFTLVVHGRAAHAGRSFDKGRNAICKAAEVITAINALNGQRDGVTINVGRVSGGGALNIVADLAIMHLDVRLTQVDDQAWVEQQLQTIIASTNQQEGFSVELHGEFGRHPKAFDEKQQKLFNLVRDTGNLLGLSIEWQPSGGCCDGNNLAAEGIAVVDSLGVRGACIHSDKEYILLDSLVERAKLTALLLMRLANAEIQL